MTILAEVMIDVLEILHGVLVTPQLLTWLTRLQLSQLFSKIIFLLYHVVVILIVVDINVIHVSSIVSLCKTFFYMLFIRKKVSNFNIVINKLHLRLIFFSSSSISSLIHIFPNLFFSNRRCIHRYYLCIHKYLLLNLHCVSKYDFFVYINLPYSNLLI